MKLPCDKYYPDIFTGVQSWQTVKSSFPAYRSLIVHYRTHRATQLTQNVTRIRQAGRKFVPRPQKLSTTIRVSLQSFRHRLIRKPDFCRVWKWKIKYSPEVKKNKNTNFLSSLNTGSSINTSNHFFCGYFLWFFHIGNVEYLCLFMHMTNMNRYVYFHICKKRLVMLFISYKKMRKPVEVRFTVFSKYARK